MAAAGQSGPVRVFVAEDEALIRLDLVETLRESGYQVVGESGDGQSAAEALAGLDVDVALLDISMPGLDGLTLARELARQRSCAVVIVTAYGQREMVERAADAGVLSYVTKPFTGQDLVAAIEIARRRFAEIASLHDDVDAMGERLAARKLIERTRSAVAAAYGMTEGEAFRVLQKRAMDTRSTMVEVCREVLQRGLGDRPPGPQPRS